MFEDDHKDLERVKAEYEQRLEEMYGVIGWLTTQLAWLLAFDFLIRRNKRAKRSRSVQWANAVDKTQWRALSGLQSHIQLRQSQPLGVRAELKVLAAARVAIDLAVIVISRFVDGKIAEEWQLGVPVTEG